LQESFSQLGGHLLEHEEVMEVIPGNDIVTLKTRNHTIRAKRVVLTTGGWAGKLLSQLGLGRIPVQVIHQDTIIPYCKMYKIP